jgi:hypothetical protein
MSINELPPRLAMLHAQLTMRGAQESAPLRYELETLGQVIETTRDESPSTLKKLDMLRETFTGGSQKACQCCGRPF